MGKWCLILCLLPGLAQAQVQADINALIDEFFGEGQAPVEETLETEINVTNNADANDIRQSIQLEETILDSFRAEVEEREAALWKLEGEKNNITRQLEQIDTQISFDQAQIETYQSQAEKWETVLKEITAQKALLNSALRAEKTDYQTLMSQAYIRAQNLGSDDKVAWWEWLFSPQTVSEILSTRAERKRLLTQKQNSLKTLEQLKRELEARERQAALVYSHSSALTEQLSTDRQKLGELIQARGNLLDQVSRSAVAEQAALAEAQTERRESTQYLVSLRDQLRSLPADVLENVDPGTESIIEERPEISVFDWPLKVAIRVTAGFRDPDYADNFEREHDGVDLFAPQGTPVYAPANGVVEKIATNGYGYSYLILAHKDDLYTVYGHLSEILVEEEEIVYIGKEIAKSGGTPGTPGAGYFTTGPHLHFEVFRDGQFFDPLDFLPSLD